MKNTLETRLGIFVALAVIAAVLILVTFGSAGSPRALDGAELNPPPPDDEPPDLNAIMQKINKVASGVERLTSSFTGDKIDNLLGPLTDFLTANKGPLTATISNVQAISTQIRQGQGTVGKLIYDESPTNLYNSA